MTEKKDQRSSSSAGFKSVAEFEARFFPKAASRRRAKQHGFEAVEAGSDLADQVLARVAQRRQKTS